MKKPQLRRIDERPKAVAAKGADAVEEEEEPAQTYDEGWQMICDAALLAKLDTTLDNSAQGDVLAAWLTENLTNKKARYWLIGLSKIEEAKKRDHFHAEAVGPGKQTTCAVEAVLFPGGTSAQIAAQAGSMIAPATSKTQGSQPGTSDITTPKTSTPVPEIPAPAGPATPQPSVPSDPKNSILE